MVTTKEEDAAISKDGLIKTPHEKDQGKISHKSNLNYHIKITVVKDNADVSASTSTNAQTEQSSPAIPPPPSSTCF